MNQQYFSNKLQMLRKNKGYTQQQLATMLNVTNKAISKWENGRGFPDITLLPKLSKILDVTIDELLNEYHLLEKKKVKQRIIREVITIGLSMVVVYVVMSFFEQGKVFTVKDLQSNVFIENQDYPGINCVIDIPSQETIEKREQQLITNEVIEKEGISQTTGGDYVVNRRYNTLLQEDLVLDSWQEYSNKEDYQRTRNSMNTQSMVIYLQQRQLVGARTANTKNTCTIYFTKFDDGYLVDMLSYKTDIQRSHSGSSAYIISVETFEKIKENLIY